MWYTVGEKLCVGVWDLLLIAPEKSMILYGSSSWAYSSVMVRANSSEVVVYVVGAEIVELRPKSVSIHPTIGTNWDLGVLFGISKVGGDCFLNIPKHSTRITSWEYVETSGRRDWTLTFENPADEVVNYFQAFVGSQCTQETAYTVRVSPEEYQGIVSYFDREGE